jgi:hypothetical protein
MKVIGEKRGRCGTMKCDNCSGMTGFLYEVEKEGRISSICTSCKSVIGLIAEGKGDVITRIWEMKMGEKFQDRT